MLRSKYYEVISQFDGVILPLTMHSEEQVKKVAAALLSSFLPKDQNETELTFHFTLPPNQSYKVWYKKTKSDCAFVKYEEDKRA